jgi:hypothetical protein
MAKYLTVGSVYKRKDGNGDYIKFRYDSDIKEALLKAIAGSGEGSELYLNLESKQKKLASLEKALSEGKISEDKAVKARERIEKIPDYVRFEIVLVTE